MTTLERELFLELLPSAGRLRPPPRRFDPQPLRPGALAQKVGVRHGTPAPGDTPIDAYGPTSRLTEGDLLRGYGLLPPRREDTA